MAKPIVIINFKNYVSGKDSLNLARNIEIYYNGAIAAVPFLDIREIAKETNLQVFSQHADYQEAGRSTGFIIPEAISHVGAVGSLINHSEHKLKPSIIRKTIERCHSAGLKAVVCCSTLKEAQKIIKFKPWAIAFEDPRLIATGKSITKEDSTLVSSFAKLLENTNILPLCGAGVSSAEDVAKALILGCKGVLVSSAVAHPSTPQGAEKFLKEVSEMG